MSNTENKLKDGNGSGASPCSVYRFSTFQEFLDVVPADKIPDALKEIGIALQGAKAAAELQISAAIDLAKKDGVKLPEGIKSILKLPKVLEWIDDGKGEVEPTVITPDGSGVTLKYKIPNVKGELPPVKE